MDVYRESGFKFFSIGIVTEDKPVDTNYIRVTPIEVVSDHSGKLNDQKQVDGASKSASNIDQKSNVKVGSVIYAKWVPLSDSNRSTSPDVYKNESVMIYRHSDSDDYYWSTVFDEPNIRRLEKVRHSFSNLPSGLNPYDDNSSYWYEISTRDQWIKIHTSNNNGESAKYDILIDTKAGKISIDDNINNSYIIDSVNRKFTMNTGTGEFNLDVETTLNSPKVTVNAQTVTVNASQTTINSETTNNGNVTINGDLKVSGVITAPRLAGKADSASTADCC